MYVGLDSILLIAQSKNYIMSVGGQRENARNQKQWG